MLANVFFSLIFLCLSPLSHPMAWSVRNAVTVYLKIKTSDTTSSTNKKYRQLCVYLSISIRFVFFFLLLLLFPFLFVSFFKFQFHLDDGGCLLFSRWVRVHAWPKSICQKNTSYHKRIIVWWVFIPLELHTFLLSNFNDVVPPTLLPLRLPSLARSKWFAFAWNCCVRLQCKLLFRELFQLVAVERIVLWIHFGGTTGLTLKIFLVRRIFAVRSALVYSSFDKVSQLQEKHCVCTQCRALLPLHSLHFLYFFFASSSFWCGYSFSFLSASKSIVCCDWASSWSPRNVAKPISSFFAILFHLYLFCLHIHTHAHSQSHSEWHLRYVSDREARHRSTIEMQRTMYPVDNPTKMTSMLAAEKKNRNTFIQITFKRNK